MKQEKNMFLHAITYSGRSTSVPTQLDFSLSFYNHAMPELLFDGKQKPNSEGKTLQGLIVLASVCMVHVSCDI